MPIHQEDLVDFSILEGSKENIQSLPGGRSAKQLAALLSPIPSAGALNAPTPEETKTLNDAMRQEYEKELLSIADKDDPLDVYDRYVRWALSAYTSVQATRESQLLPLLERATKAFLTATHYKNDPRYLRLWLNYIKYFSDSPRETFSFLARHNIGETLSLFYEEFAAWFEINGRWSQAEEVYKTGMDKQAWPVERLQKKYEQFQKRFDARPEDHNQPTSPAVPKVRAALAAKIDPFAPATTENPQSTSQQSAQPRPAASRSGKPKMAIFADTDSAAPAPSQGPAQGWDNIGSMKERRKENTIEATPWTGKTLQGGGRAGTASKMAIFKDPSIRNSDSKKPPPSKIPDVVNPKTGRIERVFVDVEAVYPDFPDETVEYSFEELRALRRGWLNKAWTPAQSPLRSISGNSQKRGKPLDVTLSDIENLTHEFKDTSLINTSTQSIVGMPGSKPTKARRMKIREVKQETQTVKTRLESPTGRKLKRKGSAEPTMTFHSKAATNDIYDMFNQPLSSKEPERDDTQSGNETDYDDDTYSTAGESTGTGRMTNEFGDDTLARVAAGGSFDNLTQSSQPTSVSPWSEFTASKHVPKVEAASKSSKTHKHAASDDLTDQIDCQNQTQTDMESFDTQAIAAIANQDFDEMKTQDIARLAGDMVYEDEDDTSSHQQQNIENDGADSLKTPVEAEMFQDDYFEGHQESRYVPIPPEDYEPTPYRSYRDPSETAQNKLPFMTPIAEQTESSIGSTVYKSKNDYFKTPSRQNGAQPQFESPSRLELEQLVMSSPQQLSPTTDKSHGSPSKRRLLDIIEDDDETSTSPNKKLQRSLLEDDDEPWIPTPPPEDNLCIPKARQPEPAIPKNPIINDTQCNPVSEDVRNQILAGLITPITAYPGYSESRNEVFAQHDTLKSFTKSSKSARSSPKKPSAAATKAEPRLDFKHSSRVYAVKRELGAGAYATAYLAHSADRSSNQSNFPTLTPTSSPRKSLSLSRSISPSIDTITGRGDYEAIKAEIQNSSRSLQFEFHIIRLLHSRLGHTSPRTVASIVVAHECHLYRDEAYLILSYSPQGTILDLLNSIMTDNHSKGRPTDGVGLDEPLAMFFSVEVLRIMEALHSVGILHGDLKADNCLVRFDLTQEITGPYDPDGTNNWSARGLTLIDFGRGIDTHCFAPGAKFIADWKPSAQDCPEINECRPWKWSLDFYGAAGVVHSLLFGKYLSTIIVPVLAESPLGVDGEMTLGIKSKKEVRVKEVMKRYLSKDIWTEVFGVLLNKGGVEDDEERMAELRRVRGLMEEWLVKEGEKRDLRGKLRGAERLVLARK